MVTPSSSSNHLFPRTMKSTNSRLSSDNANSSARFHCHIRKFVLQRHWIYWRLSCRISRLRRRRCLRGFLNQSFPKMTRNSFWGSWSSILGIDLRRRTSCRMSGLINHKSVVRYCVLEPASCYDKGWSRWYFSKPSITGADGWYRITIRSLWGSISCVLRVLLMLLFACFVSLKPLPHC